MSEYNSRSADVVGVFDKDFNQVFPPARPIKADIREDSKLMEHPVESGGTITDHAVILPVEIELTVVILGATYPDTYKLIRDKFHKKELLVVQTKTGSYPNMLIQSMPHDESAEVFDAIPMTIKLREVQLVTAQFQALPPSSVAATPSGGTKRNASTVKRGEQTGKPETAPADGGKKKSSVLYGLVYGKKTTPPGG